MYDKKTDQYASGKLLGFSITMTKIVWWLGSARTRWEKGEDNNNNDRLTAFDPGQPG